MSPPHYEGCQGFFLSKIVVHRRTSEPVHNLLKALTRTLSWEMLSRPSPRASSRSWAGAAAMESGSPCLDGLPGELLTRVMRSLHIDDMCNLAQTCWALNDHFGDHWLHSGGSGWTPAWLCAA